jgi:hypothetical protein
VVTAEQQAVFQQHQAQVVGVVTMRVDDLQAVPVLYDKLAPIPF